MRRSLLLLAVMVLAGAAAEGPTSGAARHESVRSPMLPGRGEIEAAFARSRAGPVPPAAVFDAAALTAWTEAFALMDALPQPPQAARDLTIRR